MLVFIQSILFSFVSNFDPTLTLYLRVCEIVFNWANSDSAFYSVLLCKLSCTNQEVVFAGN